MAKDSKTPFSNYKSAALPAELCRHLPGKILSDAASASLFYTATLDASWGIILDSAGAHGR
jgi:hypothetical protein